MVLTGYRQGTIGYRGSAAFFDWDVDGGVLSGSKSYITFLGTNMFKEQHDRISLMSKGHE